VCARRATASRRSVAATWSRSRRRQSVQRVRRDQLVYGFAPETPPVLTVEPGERFVVETYDASTGRIRIPEDLAAYLKARDPRKVNPAGGPIAVRGAGSGDELVVTIERIGLTDQGYVRASPGGPVLADVDGPRAMIVSVEGDALAYPGGLRLP